jgi:hypothetical protein
MEVTENAWSTFEKFLTHKGLSWASLFSAWGCGPQMGSPHDPENLFLASKFSYFLFFDIQV